MTTKQTTVIFRTYIVDNNPSQAIQHTLNVKDLDISLRLVGADLITTITNRVIPRKNKGFRFRLEMMYDLNIQNDAVRSLLNQSLTTENRGRLIQLSLNGTVFYDVVLDPSTSYNLQYNGQIISSISPTLVFLTQDPLPSIPEEFEVFI